MHNLIPYLIKLSISLTIVYLFYQLALRRLTFYNWNRWYLLGYSLLCFVIPVINVFAIVPEQSNIIQYIPVVDQFGASSQTDEPVAIGWKWLCMLVIAAGMLLMIVKLLVQYYSLFRMRSKAVLLYNDRVKLYHIDQPVIPFSFGNSIYVNQHRHSEEELKDIIHHEFIHVKQRHTFDMIVSEWLCIVNWYNPFAWLLRKAMRQNLEFIADHQVLQTGLDRKQYQYLLLKVMGHSSFSIASKFNFSNLKKRIAMMNKTQSAKVHLIRFLFMLPLLAVILLAFRNTRQQLQQPAAAVIADTTAPVSSKNIREIVSTEVRTKTNANVKCVTATELHQVVNNNKVQTYVKNEVNDRTSFILRTQDGYPVTRDTAPAPPSPPAAPAHLNFKGSENIKSMSVIKTDKDHGIILITTKKGETEKYDLSVPAEKEAFEKKYGSLPQTPAPPAAPAPVAAPVPAAPAVAPKAMPAPPMPPSPPTPPVVKKETVTITADTIHVFDSNARKTRIVAKRISGVNEKDELVPLVKEIVVVGHPARVTVN